MFYPGDPRALAAEIDDLIGGVEQLAPRLGFPESAGGAARRLYLFGGGGGAGLRRRCPARGIVKRVVLLGPVHRGRRARPGPPAAQFFDTPLGRIAVDQDAVRELAALPQVVSSAAGAAMEHSLEVQLPFLQKALGEFTLGALAVGNASVAEVAAVLERLWGARRRWFVISTDIVALSRLRRSAPHRRRDDRAHSPALATDLLARGSMRRDGRSTACCICRRRETSRSSCSPPAISGDTAGGKGQVGGLLLVRRLRGRRGLARAGGQDVADDCAGLDREFSFGQGNRTAREFVLAASSRRQLRDPDERTTRCAAASAAWRRRGRWGSTSRKTPSAQRSATRALPR